MNITERYASAYVEHLGCLFRDVDHRAAEAVARRLAEAAVNDNQVFVIGIGDAEQDVPSLSRRLAKALHRAASHECGTLSDDASCDSRDNAAPVIRTGGAARLEAMISSMTPEERSEKVELLPSRRRRIAMGSGTSIDEVNRLCKGFKRI